MTTRILKEEDPYSVARFVIKEAACTEPTNADRVLRIPPVLKAYRKALSQTRPDEADFADLLCDLMHYAHANGIDFDAELSRATDNFSEEVTS